MNKQELLQAIAHSVRQKHPWQISQEKYLNLFGELPQKFLEERQAYDNLLVKLKQFTLCSLNVSAVKIDIKLNLDELCVWELSLDRWLETKAHNILPGDIKKLLKEQDDSRD